ncbi:hypothetical protein LH433_05455 [Laribacter hongkongensis]|uniref:hypothetical protein n=1 Tax=Laribacter hongkongensis TaxID=168471 RepID=UPI001EFD360A|nr:hypothetical protein [Laribacter hongkongensis]MCG9106204.1 hypothetical protein [Laribacter hongkongensis]
MEERKNMRELLLFLGRIVWIFVMVSGWVLLFGLGWMYFTYVKPHYDEARDMRLAFEQAVVAGADLPALQARFVPAPDGKKSPVAPPEVEQVPPQYAGGVPRYVLRWQRTDAPLAALGVVFHFSAIAPHADMGAER